LSLGWPLRLHFLTAPNAVLTFFDSFPSVSLSSAPTLVAAAAAAAAFLVNFFAAPLTGVADVGVCVPDAPSLVLLLANDADSGVGACDAGVDPTEPGVCAS